MRRRSCGLAAVLLIGVGGALAASPPPARAFNPLKPVCSAAGFLSGAAGKACSAVQHTDRLISAGKKLVGGHVGSAVKTALGAGGSVASAATTALALAAIGTWVLGGAKFVLYETGHVLGETTAPQLHSTWFSATYWRVAGIAAVLTLPFLFAAAIQALIRSDMAMLMRAALGYLPLAILAVAIAAPLTMLLLSASDQLAAAVSSAAGGQSAHFLGRGSGLIGGLNHFSSSPFLGFFVALLTVAAGLVLWIELLMRAAAVYVIVLMLPLAFAALVWPARRIWAVRAVELLVALILSKFAIVAVLALGGAALSQSAGHSVTGILAGVVLLALGAFAPWALLRLFPIAEIASGAVGALRADSRAGLGALQRAEAWAGEAHHSASQTAQMRGAADGAERPDPARSEVERLDALDGASSRPQTSERTEGGRGGAAGAAGADGPAATPSPSADPSSAAGADPAVAADADPVIATGESSGQRPAGDSSGRNGGLTELLSSEGFSRVINMNPADGPPRVMRVEDEPPDPASPDEPSTDIQDQRPPAQVPEDGHL